MPVNPLSLGSEKVRVEDLKQQKHFPADLKVANGYLGVRITWQRKVATES